MIVEIIGTSPYKDTDPAILQRPMVLRVLDHPKAMYSADQLVVEILDHTDKVVAEMSIPRTELCRAVRAFEVRRHTSFGDPT